MEQMSLFGADHADQEFKLLIEIQPGHRVYQAGMQVRGRYVEGLKFYRIYSKGGTLLGLLHPMYAKIIEDRG